MIPPAGSRLYKFLCEHLTSQQIHSSDNPPVPILTLRLKGQQSPKGQLAGQGAGLNAIWLFNLGTIHTVEPNPHGSAAIGIYSKRVTIVYPEYSGYELLREGEFRHRQYEYQCPCGYEP